MSEPTCMIFLLYQLDPTKPMIKVWKYCEVNMGVLVLTKASMESLQEILHK